VTAAALALLFAAVGLAGLACMWVALRGLTRHEPFDVFQDDPGDQP
jgi:hypothetical protein